MMMSEQNRGMRDLDGLFIWIRPAQCTVEGRIDSKEDFRVVVVTSGLVDKSHVRWVLIPNSRERRFRECDVRVRVMYNTALEIY